jgi:hypothetical protein
LPGIGDQLLEFLSIDGFQPDQNHGEPVVMRLGEEPGGIGGDQILVSWRHPQVAPRIDDRRRLTFPVRRSATRSSRQTDAE